jgi:hypothetical protein
MRPLTTQWLSAVYFVHIVYFVHMWKSDKFTAYPYETKGPVYFVHFSRKYFASRRTRIAKRISVPPCLPGDLKRKLETVPSVNVVNVVNVIKE